MTKVKDQPETSSCHQMSQKFLTSKYIFTLLSQLFQTETGVNYRKKKVETAPFFTNKLVAELILETEVSLDDLVTYS